MNCLFTNWKTENKLTNKYNAKKVKSQDLTDTGKSNPTSVVSTAMGSVNSSIISVSVKRTNIQRTALLISLAFFKWMVSCCMTSENGQDLDQHPALRLLTIQQPPLLPLRPALHPPLPRTLRFGEVESGRSIRSSEPGPKSLSVPCLEDKKTWQAIYWQVKSWKQIFNHHIYIKKWGQTWASLFTMWQSKPKTVLLYRAAHTTFKHPPKEVPKNFVSL